MSEISVLHCSSIGYARASVNLYHPIGLVDPTMNNATQNMHGSTVDLVPFFVILCLLFHSIFYSAMNLDVDASLVDPAPSILGLYILYLY